MIISKNKEKEEIAKDKMNDEQRLSNLKKKLDARKKAPMQAKKDSTLWDVMLPPDFTKTK
jgi:hypothetical protein